MTNIDIDKPNNEVKLIIDTKFYGIDAVLESAKEYSEVCWVMVDGNVDDKLLVTLKPKLKEIKLDSLGYEFFNYVLGLIQNAIF